MKDNTVKNNLLAGNWPTHSLFISYVLMTENKIVYSILSFQNLYQGYTD